MSKTLTLIAAITILIAVLVGCSDTVTTDTSRCKVCPPSWLIGTWIGGYQGAMSVHISNDNVVINANGIVLDMVETLRTSGTLREQKVLPEEYSLVIEIKISRFTYTFTKKDERTVDFYQLGGGVGATITLSKQ